MNLQGKHKITSHYYEDADDDSADTTYCMTDGDSRPVKQHHWKCEAKEYHQLSHSGPSNNRRRGRSVATIIGYSIEMLI